MASQMLLRHHISSINNARRSIETGKLSIPFLNSKLGSGSGEQQFCFKISSRRILHNKRFHNLRAQSVGESNSGAFSSGINGSWKRIVGEANSLANVIPPPPDPPTNGSFIQVLSYIWNLAAGDPSLRWRLAVAIVLLFGSKLAGLGGPFLFKRAMDELTNRSTKLQSEYYIYVVVSLLILSSLTKAISSGLNEVRYVVFAPLGQAVGRRIGVYLLQHLLYLDLSFHLDQSSGVLLRILERAQRSVIHIFRAVVFTFIPTAVELVVVCALLSHQVGAAAAGIVLLAFLAYVIWTVKITTAAALSRIKANKFEERVSGKAIDALLNYETVVQFSNQSIEVVQYNRLLQSYQHAMLDAEYLSATLNGGQAAILSVGIAIVMAVTGLQVEKGVVGIGSLVLVNGLILQVAGPLQFLGFIYRDLRQSLVDLDALFKILCIKPSIEDGSIELQNRGRGVALKAANLHFSYKNSRQILHGVSFTADPGESIAIVGPSGSGKSTVVKLLLRLYDPDGGALYMDGHDICSLKKDSLRQAAAVVPQDTVLFNDTIFHNILYGLPTASEADVIRAAKQAHLHEAVLQMPKGYMTVVGERGLKLSGGEKQRVAIARAFLRGPRLLICDEATSALDSSTEASILQSLKELASGRTCVFVAHRLSTIMHCDKIMVFDDGRIVEEGTHQKLLAMGRIYANMWSLQEAQNDEKCSKV